MVELVVEDLGAREGRERRRVGRHACALLEEDAPARGADLHARRAARDADLEAPFRAVALDQDPAIGVGRVARGSRQRAHRDLAALRERHAHVSCLHHREVDDQCRAGSHGDSAAGRIRCRGVRAFPRRRHDCASTPAPRVEPARHRRTRRGPHAAGGTEREQDGRRPPQPRGAARLRPARDGAGLEPRCGMVETAEQRFDDVLLPPRRFEPLATGGAGRQVGERVTVRLPAQLALQQALYALFIEVHHRDLRRRFEMRASRGRAVCRRWLR